MSSDIVFDPLIVSSPNNGGVFYSDGATVVRLSSDSVTGLTVSQDRIIWGVQNDDSNCVVCFADGKQTKEPLHNSFSDIHDVYWDVDSQRLLVAFTHQNEVCEFDHKLQLLNSWKLPGEPDSKHVNSVVRYKGRILISMFGKFGKERGYKQGTVSKGLVMDIDTREVLISGLSQPHSLTADGDELWLCNSELKELRLYVDYELKEALSLPGYTRGIALTDSKIYVGISRSRNLEDGHTISASIISIDRSTLGVIDRLRLPCDEIYDVQLAGSHQSFVLSSAVEEARKQVDVENSEAYEKLLADKEAISAELESQYQKRSELESIRAIYENDAKHQQWLQGVFESKFPPSAHYEELGKKLDGIERMRHIEQTSLNANVERLVDAFRFEQERFNHSFNELFTVVDRVASSAARMEPEVSRLSVEVINLGGRIETQSSVLSRVESSIDRMEPEVGRLGADSSSLHEKIAVQSVEVAKNRLALTEVRDEVIKSIESTLVDQIDEIETIGSVLTKTVESFEKNLTDTLDGLETKIHDRRAQEFNQLREAHSTELTRLEDELGVFTNAVKRLKVENSFLELVSEDRKGTLEHQESELEELSSSLDRVKGDFDENRVTATDLTEQIELLRSSTSWRITKAIRNIVRLIKGEPIVDDTSNDASADLVVPADGIGVLIPAYGKRDMTVECVNAVLAHASHIVHEILVVDDCGPEELVSADFESSKVRVIKNTENLGFLRTVNRAVPSISSKYLLLLNNDTTLTADALDHMLNTLLTQQLAGIVGAKLVYPNGILQEAGVRFAPDQSAVMIGLNQNADRAEYRGVREVQFVSGACALMLTDTFRDLGGFDELFAPAYCEDADLCFRVRQSGKKIYYDGRARVEHVLSATLGEADHDKGKLIEKNVHNFFGKWSEEVRELSSVRAIAIYLPQFHEVKENNEWWGQGFTEWTNVSKAGPHFRGHQQPRIPISEPLGYYDLTDPHAQMAQAKLARDAGLSGFCYYHYWFNGKRLLEKPLESVLENRLPDFPFCVCWANENWTRRWDGKESEVLMAQEYSPLDDIEFIKELEPYLRDKRYIRVDGKPVILIYRSALLPNVRATVDRWREYCISVGIGEIYVCNVQSFLHEDGEVSPQDIGCDAAVEFPPHSFAAPLPNEHAAQGFDGAIFDYKDTRENFLAREVDYKLLRSVLVDWDNTPRRGTNATIFEGSSPAEYEDWLRRAVEYTLDNRFGDERLLFINAWNEWGEGNYLEPDERYGHDYLDATRRVLKHD
ncbi:MAG: GT2 family glycosyltransferase [Candidatus Azotimanducaceae bacterium]